MRLTEHYKPIDWCHLCGRRQYPVADIWFPENAEHDKLCTRYIRICAECAEQISAVARGRCAPDHPPAKSTRERSIEARLDPHR